MLVFIALKTEYKWVCLCTTPKCSYNPYSIDIDDDDENDGLIYGPSSFYNNICIKTELISISQMLFISIHKSYCGKCSVPPDILDYPTSQDVIVEEGQNVTLTCAATGSPEPIINWRREGGKPLFRGVSGTESELFIS